jgi:hypothetical protein
MAEPIRCPDVRDIGSIHRVMPHTSNVGSVPEYEVALVRSVRGQYEAPLSADASSAVTSWQGSVVAAAG